MNKTNEVPLANDVPSIKEMISIDVDFFEHLLNCLANQKFIGEPPPCGDAMALGKNKYNAIQKENQRIIDEAWNKGMEILNKYSKTVRNKGGETIGN